MLSAQQKITKKDSECQRLATARDLEAFAFTISMLAGTGSLPALARRWLFFFVALAKRGFTGIHAPVDAICKAEYRSNGQTRSRATAFRAFSQLEAAGVIRRQQYRAGPDRFRVKIYFELDKFAFWLRDRAHIAPLDLSYINLQLSMCAETEVTSNRSRVNSPNISNNKPPRETISKGEPGFDNPSKTRERDDPRIHTLRLVTRGLGPRRRRLILARATVELYAPNLRTSGIDWAKWTEKAWYDLYFGEREHIALTQWVPALEATRPAEPAARQNREIFAAASERDETPPPVDTRRPVSSEKVRAMIAAAGLKAALESPPDPLTSDPSPAAPAGMSDRERAILVALDLKVKAARDCL